MRTTFLVDEGLLSISAACCGQLVNMLIPLESDKNTRENQNVSPFQAGDHKAATCLHSSNHWLALQPSSMDMALLSISPASRGQLVKMLITLGPHGIFGSNI